MNKLSDRFMYYCGLLAPHGVSVDDLKNIQNLIDKQEQGLLIELPCKVGDTVFLLMNGNTRIVECTVLWIERHRNGTVVFSLDGGTGDVVMAHLGKKWFLTRSEAEEALAKKGGVNE